MDLRSPTRISSTATFLRSFKVERSSYARKEFQASLNGSETHLAKGVCDAIGVIYSANIYGSPAARLCEAKFHADARDRGDRMCGYIDPIRVRSCRRWRLFSDLRRQNSSRLPPVGACCCLSRRGPRRTPRHSRKSRGHEGLSRPDASVPDGSMLAKLAWKYVPSSEFEGAYVPGPATTVQIRTRRNTPRRVAGVLAASSTANRSTKRNTKPAFPATGLT